MFGAGYAAPEQEFNMILTVTMNPSIDTRYQLDKLIIDDVNRVTPEKTAGGKGLNVSRVLLQLGDDVLATGLLGGHMGAYMAELMDADGVKNDFVPIAGETRICLNILHEGNQTELLESGPQIAPAELEAFTAKFAELAAKAGRRDAFGLAAAWRRCRLLCRARQDRRGGGRQGAARHLGRIAGGRAGVRR